MTYVLTTDKEGRGRIELPNDKDRRQASEPSRIFLSLSDCSWADEAEGRMRTVGRRKHPVIRRPDVLCLNSEYTTQRASERVIEQVVITDQSLIRLQGNE